MRALGLLLLVSGLAESQASPYVPLDDIAYRYVDALLARGGLATLPALERPYTLNAVRSAIDSTRTGNESQTVAGLLGALEATLEKFDPRRPGDPAVGGPFRAKVTFDIYATGQTSGRRELMLADNARSLQPGANGYFVFAGGHLAGAARPILDLALNVDPDFTGLQDRPLAGRTEDGYAGGQWRYGELTFGRLARNWGPHSLKGLQLSDAPYTYDHLYARAGTNRINVSTVIARLENFVLEPGRESSRYFSIHRFAYMSGGFEAAVSEAYVYTGVGRGLEFTLINPFNVYSLSWRNERTDGNLSVGFESSWRSRTGAHFAAHLLLDDIQIDRCDTVCREPSSYGVTLTAEGLPFFLRERWYASYTRVSNLAYRTPNVAERYSIRDIGLGHSYSDYDEIRAGLDLAALPQTPLRVYLAHRRQGSGDYRREFPHQIDYGITPGFLSGTVWTTDRLGVSGASQPSRWLQLAGDAGINRSTNRRHIRGNDRTTFEGTVRVTVRPGWRIRFQ